MILPETTRVLARPAARTIRERQRGVLNRRKLEDAALERQAMTMEGPGAQRELMLFRLNRLAASSGQPLLRYCEGRYGISRREWRLIAILGLQGPCSSSELAQRARLLPAPTSKAVSQLVARSIATRSPVPNDRRQVIIALTALGREIFDALYPIVQGLNERLLSALEPKERQTLEDLIGKLEARVASWMNDVELPKADRRHRNRKTG
jgi:DNA-binding MarR family transcriptional regulator